MEPKNVGDSLDRTINVMGHPAGLFILFFTEMWERFSYYGMRALLTLFLVSAIGMGGWEWTPAEALTLYGLYTGFVYITPIFGGLIADKVTGFRKAIVIGALLMTLGHASMALETEATFYIGLLLLILGNGLFKPNISSMVGDLYKDKPQRKDAAYTIFYMGINAGAFFGIFLCGYIGEKVGWSYGFGLAGVFMLFGLLQFYFGQKIFGSIGLQPEKRKTGAKDVYEELKKEEEYEDSLGKSEEIQRIEEEVHRELPQLDHSDKKNLIQELKSRFNKSVVNSRLLVIGVLAFFTIFFWMAFEQAGGSMTIFAKDFTNRVLKGNWASTFTVINSILAIVPLAVISWVLVMLFRKTFKRFALSNIFLGLSFLIIWGIVGWMVQKEFNTKAYSISTEHEVQKELYDTLNTAHKLTHEEALAYLQQKDTLFTAKGINAIEMKEITGHFSSQDSATYHLHVNYAVQKTDTFTIRYDQAFEIGSTIQIIDLDNSGRYKYISDDDAAKIETNLSATVLSQKENEIEVPASWFGVLNSLFIIIFAPVFSKIWESRLNPSAPVKFAIGLTLLGFGFGLLAIGSMSIEPGAKTAEVSMIWLILAYLFHTLGELSVSPVGLSYVSKLSPPKLVGLMFGVWYGAIALANYIAGWTGSYVEKISDAVGLSGFFLMYTVIPGLAAIALLLMNKWLKKKMHGIS